MEKLPLDEASGAKSQTVAIQDSKANPTYVHHLGSYLVVPRQDRIDQKRVHDLNDMLGRP